MLERFRKPKWQHPDPEARRRALEELDPVDEAVLATVAREDAVPAVRRQALRRTADLALLRERAADDDDATVREQAERRYRQLFCGGVPEAPPLDARLDYLAGVDAPDFLECVAREGAEAPLRAAAVARVTKIAVLRDVVLHDADADLRLAVLARIEDESVLERICEQSRTSDKRVSHAARERLEAYREERERPVRVRTRREQIAATVETLGTDGHWERDHERLEAFTDEWRALDAEHGSATEGDDETQALAARFTSASERFVSGYQRYREAAQAAETAREAVIVSLEAALADLESAPDTTHDAAGTAAMKAAGPGDGGAGQAVGEAGQAIGGEPARDERPREPGQTDDAASVASDRRGDVSARAPARQEGGPGQVPESAEPAAAQASERAAGASAETPVRQEGAPGQAPEPMELAAAQESERAAGVSAETPAQQEEATGQAPVPAEVVAAQASERAAGASAETPVRPEDARGQAPVPAEVAAAQASERAAGASAETPVRQEDAPRRSPEPTEPVAVQASERATGASTQASARQQGVPAQARELAAVRESERAAGVSAETPAQQEEATGQAHEPAKPAPVQESEPAAGASAEAPTRQDGAAPREPDEGAPSPARTRAPADAPDRPFPDLAALVANANAAWREAPEHPDVSRAEALQARFTAARDALDALRRDRGRARLLAELQAGFDAMLAGKGPIDERAAKRLQQRHDQSAAGRVADRFQAEEKRLDKAHAALRARLRQQSDRRHALMERVPARLDELDKALEEGSSQAARKLCDGVDADLTALRALGAAADRLKPLQSRLKRLAPKVRVMQAWGQYASDQSREKLCEEMEALIGSEEPPPAIADQIRDARARWKALPPGNPANNQALWHRFNSAAGKAYEPCKAWFAERGEARKRNLALREEVLAEAVALMEGFDASAADWKALAKQRRELDQRWRRASPVDRKAGKAQESRYQETLAALDEHLARERQRCIELREGLIEAVIALQSTDDPRRAAEECKRLQRQWQVTVPASRRKEQALWKRFRDGCDVIFGKRQEVFDQRDAKGKENLAAREALCARLEALLAVDLDGLVEARQEARRIRGEWSAAGPVPRKEGAGVERTFNDLRRRFEQHAKALEAQRREQGRAALRAWSTLCGEAEALAAGGADEAQVAALEARWQALPPLADAQAGEPLAARFQRACRALADPDERAALVAEHDANREVREGICLRMEILAGVDSPPEFAAARMEAQVQRLASALGDRHAGKADDAGTLEEQWYRIGPAAPADAAALEQRFNAACAGVRR